MTSEYPQSHYVRQQLLMAAVSMILVQKAVLTEGLHSE